jgi:cyanamide hydratase
MASEHGFDALPRDPEIILKGHNKPSPYISIDDIALPNTAVARAVEEYVKKELSPETYNHSVRVYFYGSCFSDVVNGRTSDCPESFP